jgi:methyl-accepting chemotaxis protein
MLNTFTTNFQDRINSLPFKTKAISAAVLLALLPVLGVGSVAYVVSQNNLREAESNTQKLSADALSNALVRFLTLRGKDIQVVSYLPLFTNPKVIATTTVAEKEAFLNNFVATFDSFDSVSILDLQGNPIARSKTSPKDNHSDRDYFKETIRTGKPYITSVQKSRTTGENVFHMTAPLRDTVTGQLIGIVRGRMPVKVLQPIAAPYSAGGNDWHVAYNKTNKYVLAPLGEEATDATEFPAYNRLKDSEKPVTETSYSSVNKEAELTSFLKIPATADLPNLDLSVVMSKKMSLIQAKENNLLVALLLGMLTAGGATIGLSLLLSNRVTQFIQQMADSISKSSGAIVDTVEMQEVTVNMQANSAIETSTTVNELGAVSFQSAEQAESSAKGARQALSLAEDGTRAVQQTLQGMSGLRTKVNEIAQQIVNLSEQTGQITVVSDLVADLASQTNMLALNAAVEAARAGEQGKGFSVVAGEIRKLADQSKKSADKINALAEDIQTAINKTVMVTDEGTKTVNEGIDLAQSTAATFAGVTDAINNVFLNSQQISTSAKQQAVSIQAVLNSMTTISQGSQESAVGMHQVKMTTRELTQVADELKAAVV